MMKNTDITVNGTARRTAARTYDDFERLKTLGQGSIGSTSYTYKVRRQLSQILYSAVYGEGSNMTSYSNYFNENVEYDCNGNITRLWRGGLTDCMHGGFGLVDNLYMTYNGNLLTSVRDNASRMAYAGATDFDGVAGLEYPLTYNGAGSLTSDAGRRIARIDYDCRNNPVRIQFTDGNVTRYIYSATGEKLRVVYQTAVPNITVAIGSTRELMPSEILYTDSTDYLLGGALTLKNGRIDKFQFDEGYCQAESLNATQDNFTFMYYDKDHLGNVRQVTKAMGSTGTVMQTLNYYPFGAQFCDGSAASGDFQPYKYNGKELDKMHGLNTYDYGARQYNPVTARWDRMDPLAEKYYSLSLYNYCGNNPIMYIDPEGKEGVKYIDENGEKTIEENVVVLLQSKKEIPQNATPKKIERINKANIRIEKRNNAKINDIKEKLSDIYSNAVNSKGETVNFKFNIIELAVQNTRLNDSKKAVDIAIQNGIEAKTPNRSAGAKAHGKAVAAVISSASSGADEGLTQMRTLITVNNQSSGTLGHEIGHTLGLDDSYSSMSRGFGIMGSPPTSLLPSEVDKIWENAFER